MAAYDNIGVDTGGTFTDVVLRSEDGGLRVHKLLSTPDDPSRAIAEGVFCVKAGPFGLVHGTTVATNAILERKGARVAFVTTRGFEHLLFLRRQNRPQLYALNVERTPGLLPGRDACFGVEERLSADGVVITPITQATLDDLVDALRAWQPDAVAVSLLHAYANSAHEAKVAEHIREHLPDAFVSVSHEVLNQFREYERASTTAINAFVGPVMSTYLESLRERLGEAESLAILHSHGGRADIPYTRRFPVHTALSGPAGGVVGAMVSAEAAGLSNIITFDMGGTSTDVSLCDGGLVWTSEAEIDGLPIHVPVVDIVTVGAGGGSIARVDRGGSLLVGPESAGADPGPAAYGREGLEATVTDANVVLGRLRPDHFLGGEMSLDTAAARAAVGRVAHAIDVSETEAAEIILEVANAAMVRAIKVTSVERGHDPVDFTLVSFGGAGGLHACHLAEELDIPRVLIPRNPGLLSAYGMLHADEVRVVSQTLLTPLDSVLASGTLPAHIEALRARLVGEMGEVDDLVVEVDLAYVGQSYEISVRTDWASGNFASPQEAFEREHRSLYGYIPDDRDIELVNLRLVGRRPGLAPTNNEVTPDATPRERAPVVFDGAELDTLIVERRSLQVGESIDGPAIVVEYSGTAVIPPGWRFVVHASGHLIAERV